MYEDKKGSMERFKPCFEFTTRNAKFVNKFEMMQGE